jgi:hypothetical protein
MSADEVTDSSGGGRKTLSNVDKRLNSEQPPKISLEVIPFCSL